MGLGNIGDEEIMGRYGVGTRNKKGLMVADFAKMMDLAVVKTYFKKKHEHRVTYESGRKSTQVDYVMCRRRDLKEMCNCKVMVNECVAKQHRMVVCKMAFMVKKKMAKTVKPKIRWCKLKKISCQKGLDKRRPGFWEASMGTGYVLYKESETVVRCAVGTTKSFKIKVELHQGSALSPFLFAVIIM